MLRITLLAVFVLSMLAADISQAVQAPAEKQQFSPKKVEVDSNYDGKVDRIETYDASGQIAKVEVDSDANGKIEEWIIYKNGIPAKKERDTNGDGKPDVWIDY